MNNVHSKEPASIHYPGDLWFVSSKGAHKDEVFVPHRQVKGRYAGAYIVSPDKYQKNYIPVYDPNRLKSYLAGGYSIRMSPIVGKAPPSLVRAESVRGWR